MAEADHQPEGKMRPARGADLIIPVLATAFTLYFFADTFRFTWEAKANGVMIGSVLLALVAIQFVRVALQVRSGRGTLRLGALAERSPAQYQRLAVVGILALFVATIGWLGTTLGLFLTMLSLMWALGVRRWTTLLGVSLATAAAVYLLFIALLQARMPRGLVENAIAALTGAGG